jgi:amino acid adenylation domain-containing protein
MNTLNQYFELQAALRPDATAVVYKDSSVTYAELNRRAKRLAALLREEGIGHKRLVAILMDRSIEMIVAMLGIIKAGGAYVPLDPCYPAERLGLMLGDTQADVLLTQSHLASRAKQHRASVIEVNFDWGSDIGDEFPDPPNFNTAECLAYVMYTSGSTGRPKGVMVPHRAIMRLVLDANYVKLDSDSVVLQLAPVSFDASTFEIWAPLLNGGRCVLFSKNGPPDTCELSAVLKEKAVNTMWLTASLFNSIVAESPETLKGVQQILTGGEALSAEHIRIAQENLPETRLINGYGPTETTTFAAAFSIPCPIPEKWTSIPIGYAINQTELRVLDEDLQPVPEGAEGELFIGGHGVALGYLHQPELTAEKFLVDPFSVDADAKLYRTGDIVRSAPDGCLDFIGRKDDQIKLRGFRIEPGEIEHILLKHDAVIDAKVLISVDTFDQKRLTAYLVAKDDKPLDTSELRQFLTERLPEYMIPSRFGVLKEFPLTANGKLDRERLPSLSTERPQIKEPYQAPRNKVERWLSGIWQDLLNLDKVGIKDPFFELGGDSLRAARFISKVRTELNISVPLVAIYDCYSIERFAQLLANDFGSAVWEKLNLSADAKSQSVTPSLRDARVLRRGLAADRRRARISEAR